MPLRLHWPTYPDFFSKLNHSPGTLTQHVFNFMIAFRAQNSLMTTISTIAVHNLDGKHICTNLDSEIKSCDIKIGLLSQIVYLHY